MAAEERASCRSLHCAAATIGLWAAYLAGFCSSIAAVSTGDVVPSFVFYPGGLLVLGACAAWTIRDRGGVGNLLAMLAWVMVCYVVIDPRIGLEEAINWVIIGWL